MLQKVELESTLSNMLSQLAALGSLSARVSETRTATGREHFACKDGIVSQIFILLISNREKILRNVNVVVWGQVKSENSSLPVVVRVSKLRMLKLPIKTSSTWKNGPYNVCYSGTSACDHLYSATSFLKYQKLIPAQITIFGTSCKRPALVSDRDHF